MPYKIYPAPSPPQIKIRGAPKPPRTAPDVKTFLKSEKRYDYEKEVSRALDAGIVLPPYVEEVELWEDEEDYSECEETDFLIRQTASFRCLAQVVMSSSSFFRSVEYNFPLVEDPGLDDAIDYEDPIAKRDDEGVEVYLDQCKTYKILPLKRVLRSFTSPYMNLKFYGLRKYQMRCLTEALKTNEYVEYLMLQNNHLTPQMVDWLGECLEENTVINHLYLKCCNIGTLGAAKLAKHMTFMDSLTHLDLSYNELGAEGMKKLRPLTKMPNLLSLDLSNNNLTPDSADSVDRVLTGCKTLEEINLSGNRLGGSNESCEILFNALESSRQLRVVNLHFNGCCDDPAVFTIFSAYLTSTTTLEELDITNNRIPGGLFIKELRKGVMRNSSLKILKIGNNPWTPAQAFALAQLIKLSSSLTVLDMENIWFTKKVNKLLEYARLEKKKLIIGGIYQNWQIIGPDWKWLIWKRIKAIFAAPKRVDQRQDFGDFLLTLSPEPSKIGDFEEQMMKKKYVQMTKDVDLINSFYAIYKENNKLEVGKMIADYFNFFPKIVEQEIKVDSKKGDKTSKKSKKDSKSSEKSTVSIVDPTKEGKQTSKTDTQKEGSKSTEGDPLAPIQEDAVATSQ